MFFIGRLRLSNPKTRRVGGSFLFILVPGAQLLSQGLPDGQPIQSEACPFTFTSWKTAVSRENAANQLDFS